MEEPPGPPRRRFSDLPEGDRLDVLNWKVELFGQNLVMLDGEVHMNFNDIRASLRQADQEVNTRIGDVRRDLDRLSGRLDRIDKRIDARIDERIEVVGSEHEEQIKPSPWFWLKVAAACATGGGVPIAIAILSNT